MAAKRVITLSCIVLIVLGGSLSWYFAFNRVPVLVFNGYLSSKTNGAQFAELKLQNTTKKPIWIIRVGRSWPLHPTFLQKQLGASTNGIIQFSPDSDDVGSFFLSGEKLIPGQRIFLNAPLYPGNSSELIGVCYYSGNFKDGNDLIEATMLSMPTSDATFRDRMSFYWKRLKINLHVNGPHEVWCKQPVSFQSQTNSLK